RSVNQLDLIWQHRLDTVSEDGVRVASAYFHDVNRIVAGTGILDLRHERADFLQEKLCFFGIAEFVDVFHFVFFLGASREAVIPWWLMNRDCPPAACAPGPRECGK